MGRTRAQIRGSRLLPGCVRANTTTHEYGPEDDDVYCYGLEDACPGIRNDECRMCAALIWNDELRSRKWQA